MSDLRFEWHGSVVLARPETEAARAWLDDTAPPDAMFVAGALALEPRYAEGVVAAARAAGLTVGGDHD